MTRLLVAGILFAAALLPAGCQDKKAPTQALATAGRQALPVTDFETKVRGKTATEVVSAIGDPDQRIEIIPNRKEEWTYASIAVNPNTNKPYVAAKLTLENNRVAKIEYVE